MLSLILGLALPAFGAVHETLSALPFGWTESSLTVSHNNPIQLQVALQYRNLDRLETLLEEVSTPGRPTYGHYLDLAEQNAIFGASSENENAVLAWLHDAGITNVQSDGSIITLLTTVGNANSLLNTNFRVYTNGQTNKLRTTAYSIPDHLVHAIDLVSPTTYFGDFQAHAVIPRGTPTLKSPTKRQFQTSCETTIALQLSANVTKNFPVIGPECLKQLYNIGDYKTDIHSGSSVAFGNFLNQSASYSDLALFEQQYNLPSQNFTVLALINGGVDDQNPQTEQDGEANLDVQNLIGLVDGLPVGAYITGGSPPFVPDLLAPNASLNSNEPYLEYYSYLLAQSNDKLPYVITNSYGDHENTVPENYAKRVCNMIGMMGLRGRTILESSGDEGVGAVCRNNEPPYQAQFTPQFPGTCPYVTAVGGTQFFNPEWAWNASSGGFSFYFPTAFYQKDAINTYLTKYISAETRDYYSSNNFTNFRGRGFPDISAHSLYPDYLTYINGTAQPNGGTSAASPVVAAIMTLLNDARFRAGKPALGFVNPLLYSISSSLNDITEGAALGCAGVDLQNDQVIAGAGIIPYASWNATVGWDPVTGLGTPNFQQMVKAVLEAC